MSAGVKEHLRQVVLGPGFLDRIRFDGHVFLVRSHRRIDLGRINFRNKQAHRLSARVESKILVGLDLLSFIGIGRCRSLFEHIRRLIGRVGRSFEICFSGIHARGPRGIIL